MQSTSYKEIDASAFSDDSTWMNLGLWSKESQPTQTFTEANVALAHEIGRHLNPSITNIIDLGCGRGDSLSLWRQTFPTVNRIYGVNSSRAEYQAASERFRGDRKISLFFSDAVEFLERDLKLQALGIVSVDALYHFKPDRLTFLTTAKESKAISIACSDVVLSERWALEDGKLDFITQALRRMFLSAVCYLAGIPRINLSYGPSEFRSLFHETGWKETHFEIVTDRVFYPFAQYCSARAGKLSWCSKQRWSLMSSGGFMRLLNWLQAVDFIIYAGDSR